MQKNICKLIEVLIIIIGLLIGNIISYRNISMYLMLLLLLLLYEKNKDVYIDNTTNFFSCIFSCFITFGNLSAIYSIESFEINILLYYAICFFCYFFLFRNILILIYNKSKDFDLSEKKTRNENKSKFIAAITFIGFILYIPYLLEFFPGITSFDTYNQLSQILGITNYSNHHPIVHTLILKIFFDLGFILFKNRTLGILFFTIFQMLFVSFTFSNVLFTLYEKGIKKSYLMLLILFYYFLPYNSLYSITAYKDVLFSCVTLLFVLFLYNNSNDRITNLKKIQLILLSFFICMLRTNGKIGIILFLLLILIKGIKKYKEIFLYTCFGLLLCFIFNYLLINVFNVTSVESIESLSVPIQNISYVIRYDGKISKAEKKELKKIIDIEKVKELYDEDFVDPVKNIINIDYLNKNKLKYLKLWINIGFKNKNMYLKSYIHQTSGYWYHNYGINTFPYTDNYDDLGVKHRNYNFSFVSKIIKVLIYINRAVQHVLWSNALSIYIIIYSLYSLIKGKKNNIYIYILLFIWLTLLLATPVGYEFRYQYSIFISFPFVLCTLYLKKVDCK